MPSVKIACRCPHCGYGTLHYSPAAQTFACRCCGDEYDLADIREIAVTYAVAVEIANRSTPCPPLTP